MNNTVIKFICLNRLHLRNYKEHNDSANFSCPICGDSKKSSTKARGHILKINDYNTYFYCHNCMVSMPFLEFLKEIDYSTYQYYLSETRQSKMKTFRQNRTIKIVNQNIEEDNKLRNDFKYNDAISIMDLDKDHPARKYLIKRHITSKHFKKLFYFKGNPYNMFRDLFKSDKYKDKYDLKIEHEGIVIPRINQKGKLVGFSLRMLNKHSTLRYLNLTIEGEDFFFNQFKTNWAKKVYILEGQFDVLSFDNLQNKIAMCSINKKFGLIPPNIKNNIVYVIDNEYTKKEVVNSVKKIIDEGYSIMIWPKYANGKDINELKIANEWNDDELINFINAHTYIGMKAKLAFQRRLSEEY